MEFKIKKDPIEKGKKLFNKTIIELESGKITCVVGCNGSGKTTLIRELKNRIKENGGKELKQDFYHKGFDILFGNNKEKEEPKCFYIDFDKKADCANKESDYFFNRFGVETSSTGEGIVQRFGRYCAFIGSTIRSLEEGTTLFIFLDDCDAGTSIDMITDIKEIFPLIIEDSEKLGINIYVITTANSYEFCKECDCVSVHDFKHKTFKSYETYKKFVLKSREIKDNRGW